MRSKPSKPKTALRVPMSTRVKAWRDDDIHQQLSSPLFTLIPLEVRELVLEFALTETTIHHPVALSHNFDIQHGHPPVEEADLEDIATRPLPPPPATRQPQSLPRRKRVGHTGENWLRPGNTGPKVIYCALLRTCRRIYLEAAHIPAQQKELIIYGDNVFRRGPPWDLRQDSNYYTRERSHPGQRMCKAGETIPYHALSRIHQLQVFAQLSWLDREFNTLARGSFLQMAGLLLQPSPPPSLSRLRFLDNVQILRLTIRRADWMWYDANYPLMIFPFDHSWGKSRMEAAMAAPPTTPLPVTKNSWSAAFALMPSLRTLTIDFESTDDKRAELERIVRWAVRAWRFLVFTNPPTPACLDALPPPHFLLDTIPPDAPTLDGRPVRRMWLTSREKAVERWSWRGLPFHFARRCPACDRPSDSPPAGCVYCVERVRLEKRKLGPRLLVWSVTWTAEEDEVFNRRSDEVCAAEGPGPGPAKVEVPTWAASDGAEMALRKGLEISL